MTAYAKHPPAYDLILWTLDPTDNTASVVTFLDDGIMNAEVTRFNQDGGGAVAVRFVDHNDPDQGAAFLQHNGINDVWVGLNPARTSLADRYITVTNDAGTPYGYTEFSSIY